MLDYVDSSGIAGPKIDDHTNPLFLFNPIYHTSLLFWAAMASDAEVDCTLLRRILSSLEAYPEGPVAIRGHMTPCHAAA